MSKSLLTLHENRKKIEKWSKSQNIALKYAKIISGSSKHNEMFICAEGKIKEEKQLKTQYQHKR